MTSDIGTAAPNALSTASVAQKERYEVRHQNS